MHSYKIISEDVLWINVFYHSYYNLFKKERELCISITYEVNKYQYFQMLQAE